MRELAQIVPHSSQKIGQRERQQLKQKLQLTQETVQRVTQQLQQQLQRQQLLQLRLQQLRLQLLGGMQQQEGNGRTDAHLVAPHGTTTTDAYEINESQESCAPGILDEEDTKHVKQLLQFMADKLASNKLQYRDEWNKNPATAVRDLVDAWAEEAFPELSPEDRASWVNAQWGPEKRPASRRLSSSSDHSFWSEGPSFWSFSDGLD